MNTTVGYNFAGFLENRNEIADTDVSVISKNSLVYERAPGGAITSKVNPFVYRKGWGINMQCIDAVLPEGAVDEDGNGRDKWIQRMDEQPDYSYIDDMIERHEANPNLRLIWVANCLTGNVADNMAAIREMIYGGVRITHIEADNEAYGKDKYQDFGEYASKFQPLFDAIKAEFPDIKRSICLAPFNKGVQAHSEWNTAAFNYDAAHNGSAFDTTTIHFYYDDRNLEDAPGLGDAFEMYPTEKQVVDMTTGNEALNNCFKALRSGMMQNGGWIDELSDAKELFPNKTIIVTEFNTHPAEYFCNTLVNEAWIFMMFLMRDPQVDALCVHNGNSPALYGRWTTVMRQDDYTGTGNTIRRLGAFALQMLSEIDEVNKFPVSDGNLTIASVGKYNAWFVNLEEYDIPHMFSLPVGYKMVATPTINYVQGKQLYSSSGAAGWMPKSQPKSYEISGITRTTYSELIPKYSFGYYSFEVVKEVKEKPVKNKWWQNLWSSIFGRKATPINLSHAHQYALQMNRAIN